MIDPFQSIQKIQDLLSSAGIDSIVIGGIAVAIWGEPRVTRDIDLKVLLSRDEAERLVTLLSEDYRLLASDPIDSLRKQGLLFIENRHGMRIDLLVADTPYDIQAIQRGREITVQPGVEIRVCSPEDLVIYKMISTRSRDIQDAQGVVWRQGDRLDVAYILNWLQQFEQALDDSTLIKEFKKLRKHNH